MGININWDTFEKKTAVYAYCGFLFGLNLWFFIDAISSFSNDAVGNIVNFIISIAFMVGAVFFPFKLNQDWRQWISPTYQMFATFLLRHIIIMIVYFATLRAIAGALQFIFIAFGAVSTYFTYRMAKNAN